MFSQEKLMQSSLEENLIPKRQRSNWLNMNCDVGESQNGSMLSIVISGEDNASSC